MSRLSKRWFNICECIAWPPGKEPQCKWWIMETNITIDGPRTRVTDHKFMTRQQAEDFLTELNAG